MNTEKVVITLFAKDRPGIVKTLSKTVLKHEGNWLESSLSRLCGQFAGIVHIEINRDRKSDLLTAFDELANEGLQITLQDARDVVGDDDPVESIQILVEANDRPGIVNEIAGALAKAKVNVDNMDTECESASMAGYDLFRAHLFLALPDDLDQHDLEEILERVSDDLVVSILDD